MDAELRELERAAHDVPADEASRVRFVGALARTGRFDEAWHRARARADASLADAIFEAAKAPFTLRVEEWPHPTPLPSRTVRCRSTAVVGRRHDVELSLPSPWLPGRNCLVRHQGGSSFLLLDLNGANGTYKGDRRIAEAPLEDGGTFSPGSPEIVIAFQLGWPDEAW